MVKFSGMYETDELVVITQYIDDLTVVGILANRGKTNHIQLTVHVRSYEKTFKQDVTYYMNIDVTVNDNSSITISNKQCEKEWHYTNR